MPNKLEFAPDYWRKRAAETRGIPDMSEPSRPSAGSSDVEIEYTGVSGKQDADLKPPVQG